MRHLPRAAAHGMAHRKIGADRRFGTRRMMSARENASEQRPRAVPLGPFCSMAQLLQCCAQLFFRTLFFCALFLHFHTESYSFYQKPNYEV